MFSFVSACDERSIRLSAIAHRPQPEDLPINFLIDMAMETDI